MPVLNIDDELANADWLGHVAVFLPDIPEDLQKSIILDGEDFSNYLFKGRISQMRPKAGGTQDTNAADGQWITLHNGRSRGAHVFVSRVNKVMRITKGPKALMHISLNHLRAGEKGGKFGMYTYEQNIRPTQFDQQAGFYAAQPNQVHPGADNDQDTNINAIQQHLESPRSVAWDSEPYNTGYAGTSTDVAASPVQAAPQDTPAEDAVSMVSDARNDLVDPLQLMPNMSHFAQGLYRDSTSPLPIVEPVAGVLSRRFSQMMEAAGARDNRTQRRCLGTNMALAKRMLDSGISQDEFEYVASEFYQDHAPAFPGSPGPIQNPVTPTDVCEHIMKSWEISSWKGAPACALQRVAADVFQDSTWASDKGPNWVKPSVWESSHQMYNDPIWKHVAQGFVQAQYQHTQDLLKKAGITHVAVVRGVSFDPPDAIKASRKDTVTRPVPKDLIRPQRGLNLLGQIVNQPYKLSISPLSSYTVDPRVCWGFGKHLFYSTVPADHVFSIAGLGMGDSERNQEVVLRGGKGYDSVLSGYAHYDAGRGASVPQDEHDRDYLSSLPDDYTELAKQFGRLVLRKPTTNPTLGTKE